MVKPTPHLTHGKKLRPEEGKGLPQLTLQISGRAGLFRPPEWGNGKVCFRRGQADVSCYSRGDAEGKW